MDGITIEKVTDERAHLSIVTIPFSNHSSSLQSNEFPIDVRQASMGNQKAPWYFKMISTDYCLCEIIQLSY